MLLTARSLNSTRTKCLNRFQKKDANTKANLAISCQEKTLSNLQYTCIRIEQFTTTKTITISLFNNITESFFCLPSDNNVNCVMLARGYNKEALNKGK